MKLEKLKTPIRLDFLVCLDEGDEALLSLYTLKELSIVPWNFPTPMDRHMREPKARRVVREYDSGYDEEEEWQEQKDREEEKEKGMKQKDRQVQERELFTLQERVGSLRSHIEMRTRKGVMSSNKLGSKTFPKYLRKTSGKRTELTVSLLL